MKTFVIISDPNACAKNHGCDFAIHRAGCQAIALATRSPQFSLSGGTSLRQAETAEELVAKEVAEFRACDQEYGTGDFHIHHCCK